MAITRCPYCRAIIDKKDQYCNNCGTQLLFPEDESAEEEIPGEKIIDEDFEEKDYEIPEEADEGSKKDDEGEEEEVIVIDEEKKEEKSEERPLTPPSPLTPGRTPKMKALTFSTEELEKIGETSEFGNVTVEKFLEVLKEREARKAEADTEGKEDQDAKETEEAPPEPRQEPDEDQTEEFPRARGERLIAPTDELPPWAKEIKKPGSVSEAGETEGEGEPAPGERAEGKAEREEEIIEAKGDYSGEEGKDEEGRESEKDQEEAGGLDEEPGSGAAEQAEEKRIKMMRNEDEEEEEEEIEEEGEPAEPTTEDKEPARDIRPSDSGIGLPERITQAKLPFDTGQVQDLSRKREPEKRAIEAGKEIREEKEEAPLPPIKLSSFLKGKLFDMLFMGVFWLVSIWLASRSMEVGLFQLLSAAAGTVILYYGALLVLYFFLFHFFLGETLGDRLFRERD